MKKLLLYLLLFLQTFFVKAQLYSPKNNLSGIQQQNTSFENHCATDEMTKLLYEKYPDRKKKAATIDSAIYQVMKNAVSARGSRGIVYTIPVVVHIIHNNGPENISNIQVLQGIQDLNEAFSNTGAYVDANGVDVEIQFCLAQRDPNGNATNGITRDVSSLTNLTVENDDIQMKNINRWNPLDYLNIWLVNEITSLAVGSGVAGYAYFPSSHGNPEDGIVNEARWFGSTKDNSKIHVHEAGHYLGLYHTFDGGCVNNNCLLDGDKVCDTPPDNSTAVVACNGSTNTCTTDDDDLSTNNPFRPVGNGGIGDQNDLFVDYMDYGLQPCQKLLTTGQKDRMRTALTLSRASLLQSQGCITPCTNVIALSFTASATTIAIGTNVVFTNTSTGTINNYNWTINNTSFAITQHSNYTFNTVGNYWVVLTENNSDPNCQKKDSLLIKVICNARATFTSSATSINPGGSATFTSTSSGAISYQWYIDGVPQVCTPNFTHTFPAAGGFMVYLVACNTNCCDTSYYQFIKVGLCTSKEGNIWYFGDGAGVDFNSGAPVALTNNAMSYVMEGTSTISDKNGQLLFYTDGVTVWNKNHQVMQNGSGLWAGDPTFGSSSEQAATIIKKPGSNNLYYIFTVDYQAGAFSTFPYPGAHAYSIVDMNANGGLGAVITKNTLIYTSTCERLSAIKHSNGTDVWIVSHKWQTDEIRAYLLTCNGLDTIPIISHTGIIASGNVGMGTNGHAQGAISFSPNGKKMAEVYPNLGIILLFDFNTSIGNATSPISISHPTYQAWMCVFSPDNSKMYFTLNSNPLSELHQINLNAGSNVAIINSDLVIGIDNSGISEFRDIQLASDGKIYAALQYSTWLSVVQAPNLQGTSCSFVLNGVNLLGKTCLSGLQNIPINFFGQKKASKIQGDTAICNTNSYYIKNNCDVNGDSIVWILNGHSTIAAQQGDSITLKPIQAGVDTLISIQYAACGVVSDTLLIHTKTGGSTINIGKDTVFCNAISLQLNAGSGYPSYLWSTTATTQTISVLNPGAYWVEVTDTSGCKSKDTIIVTQGTTKPNVNLGNDITICPGKVIPLNAGSGYMNYHWYDNSTNQTNTAWLPGAYWVKVVDSCGNNSSDTIKVIIDNSGGLSLGPDKEICNNETFTLIAGNGYATYLWQDGSTNQTYTAVDSGTYIVQVTTNDGCAYSDTLRVADCTIKLEDCEIGIPDAFSPNGDGINDELKILGKCIDKLTFVVFDRWGEKVFETNTPNQGWDGTYKGKQMDNTVFAYYLKVITLKGAEINLKGNVSLIR